jgi:LPXTG-site transpeptidase (sortase) family protein
MGKQTLQKLCSLFLIVSFLFTFSPTGQVKAATITVTTLAGGTASGDGYCSLQEAISAAINDMATDACSAGSGNDTIAFSVIGTIPISSAISMSSAFNGTITIDGGNAITLSGSSSYLFYVMWGVDLTLQNIILTGTGGGVSLSQASTLRTNGATFSGFPGRAIDATSSTVVVDNSIFASNSNDIYTSNFNGSPAATVNNSTFRYGYDSTYPNVQIMDGSLNISGSRFYDNTDRTCLLMTSGTTLTMSSTYFTDNTSASGNTAISNSGTADITLSRFINNQITASGTVSGGAIGNSGSMTIDRSLFDGNGVTSTGGSGYAATGGAIFSSGTLNITRSFFNGNVALSSYVSEGGALNIETGTASVANSTFTGNSAMSGAVIYIDNGALTLTNNTFKDNIIALRYMFAGYIHRYNAGSATLHMYNNVISEAVGYVIPTYNWMACSTSATTSVGNYVLGGGCGGTSATASELPMGSISGSTYSQTFPLLPGNIAINGGDAGTCESIDQRGIARPQQSICDAGAFESRGFAISSPSGSGQSANLNSAFTNPLTLSIAPSTANGEPVDGGYITFTAPSSGASTSFAPSTTVLISSGAASLPVTANAIEGSYNVSATTNGAPSTLTYALSNMDPPDVVSIVRADTSPTTASQVDFTVTFSEAVTGVDATDFNVVSTNSANGIIEDVTGSGTTWNVSVYSITGEGTLGLNLIDNDSIIDASSFPLGGSGANNGNFTGEVYTIDRLAPTIMSINLTSTNPAEQGSTVNFEVVFSEIVNNADEYDFDVFPTGSVTGFSVGTVSGNGTDTITVPVNSGTGVGTIRLQVLSTATINDAIGNAYVGPATSTGSYTLQDTTAPTITAITALDTNPTNAASVRYSVTFSEDVMGVDTADFEVITSGTLSGVSISGITGSDDTYTLTVNTGSGSGTLYIHPNLPASISDLNMVDFTGTSVAGDEYTIDNLGPQVNWITRADASPVLAGATVNYTIVFNESVSGVQAADFTLTTTGGISGASIGTPSGSGTTWTVPVSVGSASGTIRLDIDAGATIIDTLANALTTIYTSGEVYTVDADSPQVTGITRADANPTAAASVDFTVDFSEDVSGLDSADLTVSTSGSISGASVATISSGTDSYTVSVNTGTGSGTIRLDVVSGASISDTTGNDLANDPYTGDEFYTLDRETGDVTSILRENPLSSLTNAATVIFRVTFVEGMQNVDTSDFVLNTSGTAAGTINAVIIVNPEVYDITVTTISGTGELALEFYPGHNITDLLGNALPAVPTVTTSESYMIDNEVIIISADGLIGNPGAQTIVDGQTYFANFTSMIVNFSKDANNPAGDSDPDDVTNPLNYLLLQTGPDGDFNTEDCYAFEAAGNMPVGDDVLIPTGPVTYANNGGSGSFTATVTLNGGSVLPSGYYRLFVCGSTSIYDLAGNALYGGFDAIYSFTAINTSNQSGTTLLAPATGFAPDQTTAVSPAEVSYSKFNDLEMEIPALGIEESIVGVPYGENTWDITWLKDNIGWLAGTAYPTWAGNTVLTGHLYTSDGKAGPFVGLGTLKWGDEILIHQDGKVYTYAVRSVREKVSPKDTSYITRHEVYDWITLMTCQGYDESSESYRYRTVVRAVLVSVSEE